MQESHSDLAMALPMVNWHTLNSWVLGQSRLTLFSCRWLLLAVMKWECMERMINIQSADHGHERSQGTTKVPVALPMVNWHILTVGSLVRAASHFWLFSCRRLLLACCHEVRMERMKKIQSADQDHERSL